MNTETAIVLIGQLVYKPGWILEAEDHTSRYQGAVKLTIHYPAADSNRDRAPLGYPEVEPSERQTPKGTVPPGTPTIRPCGKANASFTLLVGQVQTPEFLYHLVTCAIMEIEEHEMREFLRTRETWWAPFHPHREDGIRRWASVTGQEFKFVHHSDLHFGLA